MTDAQHGVRQSSGSHLLFIVDDDLCAAALLVELFRRDGCAVKSALGVRDTLDALSGGTSPQVIVLNARLTTVDGETLQHELHQRVLSIPTVVVTANPDPERCAARAGAVAYLAVRSCDQDLDGVLGEIVVTRRNRHGAAGRAAA